MLAAIAAATVGCSSVEPAVADSSTETTSVSPEDLLRSSAEEMNQLVAAREAGRVWEFYSLRCQKLISGGVETFRLMFDQNYRDRNLQPREVTVRVEGSYGQVVTVDPDVSAPASSMEPRTWTFIDNEWQFDNC
jgi:hypothetical protein